MQANAVAFAAFEAAAHELGRDNANRLLPMVHFAGMVNADGVQLWQEQLQGQNARIARHDSRARP
jgi:hypothetical protein